jgi:hypothetical protein
MSCHAPSPWSPPECGSWRRNARLETFRYQASGGPLPGKQKIGLPPQLVQLLEDHRRQQDQERTRAGQLWWRRGEFDRPVRPRGHAELRLSRLEGAVEACRRARDTSPRRPAHSCDGAPGPRGAGTHSHGCDGLGFDVHGHQHVTDPIRHEVANRVGGSFGPRPKPTETRAAKPPLEPVTSEWRLTFPD